MPADRTKKIGLREIESIMNGSKHTDEIERCLQGQKLYGDD